MNRDPVPGIAVQADRRLDFERRVRPLKGGETLTVLILTGSQKGLGPGHRVGLQAQAERLPSRSMRRPTGASEVPVTPPVL